MARRFEEDGGVIRKKKKRNRISETVCWGCKWTPPRYSTRYCGGTRSEAERERNGRCEKDKAGGTGGDVKPATWTTFTIAQYRRILVSISALIYLHT